VEGWCTFPHALVLEVVPFEIRLSEKLLNLLATWIPCHIQKWWRPTMAAWQPRSGMTLKLRRALITGSPGKLAKWVSLSVVRKKIAPAKSLLENVSNYQKIFLN
jgi:hypothetical protein